MARKIDTYRMIGMPLLLALASVVVLSATLLACDETEEPFTPVACSEPNPQGCKENGCQDGYSCVVTAGQCRASSCVCDDTTGSWECTADCAGGVCVADNVSCQGPNPQGCTATSCGADEVCDFSQTKPTLCMCNDQGEWYCTADPGGTCVPAKTCEGPNPAGCLPGTCGENEQCVVDIAACRSSSCFCDPVLGAWTCTPDCSGGTCMPLEPCAGPNPAGCTVTGCEYPQVCATHYGCTSSVCFCSEAGWVCSTDCGGGTCVDPGEACSADSDCDFGAGWCQDGVCVPCENTYGCDSSCLNPSEAEMRNGCYTCRCVEPNACVADAECDEGEICQPGDLCLDWCLAGDPACCYGNQCVPGGGDLCTSDADCTAGAEWCEAGRCVQCDNSGLACFLACVEGEELAERNGCFPCECVPITECKSDADCADDAVCLAGDLCLFYCPAGDPTCCYGNTCVGGSGAACSSDADCAAGFEWCEAGRCVACDNSGQYCDLACGEGFEFAPERNGCQPCGCVPISECQSSADCNAGEVCIPGDACWMYCGYGDPSCCYGNTCQAGSGVPCGANGHCSEGERCLSGWCVAS